MFGRLGGAPAGRLGASWVLLGRTGGGLGRPGGVLGASWGVLAASWERVRAVMKRAGSEEPNPRQGSQLGALGERTRKSALEAKSRILDRGRSFEHEDIFRRAEKSRILDRGRRLEPWGKEGASPPWRRRAQSSTGVARLSMRTHSEEPRRAESSTGVADWSPGGKKPEVRFGGEDPNPRQGSLI